MKVNLIGQTYVDNIFNVENLVYGDTNKLDNVVSNLGGVHNISKNINSMNYNIISTGKTEATIINDIKNSTRTSFTRRVADVVSFEKFPYASWTHIAYLDDIEHYDKLDIDTPYSIDFCTCQNRTPYLEMMNNADLIFDSRERSYLYNSIKINTPIILHQPNRIDCIINGQLSCYVDVKPINNLKVNGAGDIFAAYFILLHNAKKIFFINTKIRRKMILAHHLTVKKLKEINNEKI